MTSTVLDSQGLIRTGAPPKNTNKTKKPNGQRTKEQESANETESQELRTEQGE